MARHANRELQRLALGIVAALAFSAAALAQGHSTPHNYVPTQGYVPDTQTAIRIAIAVLEPIYGKQVIGSETPYIASLKHGVWTVVGTFHHPPGTAVGGVAIAEISKRDGTILRISHGQ